MSSKHLNHENTLIPAFSLSLSEKNKSINSRILSVYTPLGLFFLTEGRNGHIIL